LSYQFTKEDLTEIDKIFMNIPLLLNEFQRPGLFDPTPEAVRFFRDILSAHRRYQNHITKFQEFRRQYEMVERLTRIYLSVKTGSLSNEVQKLLIKRMLNKMTYQISDKQVERLMTNPSDFKNFKKNHKFRGEVWCLSDLALDRVGQIIFGLSKRRIQQIKKQVKEMNPMYFASLRIIDETIKNPDADMEINIDEFHLAAEIIEHRLGSNRKKTLNQVSGRPD